MELEPELTMLSGGQPWLRLRIANRERGRQYVVKSIPALLDDVEHGRSAGYGRFLTFVHRWDAFDEESRQLLQLLRRQVNAKQSMETNVVRSYSYAASDAPAGGLPLTGEIFDALVQLYAPTGTLGGYALQEGLPGHHHDGAAPRGGVQIEPLPALNAVHGLDYDYLYSADTLWRLQRASSARIFRLCRRCAAKACFSPVPTPPNSAAMCCRSWAAS